MQICPKCKHEDEPLHICSRCGHEWRDNRTTKGYRGWAARLKNYSGVDFIVCVVAESQIEAQVKMNNGVITGGVTSLKDIKEVYVVAASSKLPITDLPWIHNPVQ